MLTLRGLDSTALFTPSTSRPSRLPESREGSRASFDSSSKIEASAVLYSSEAAHAVIECFNFLAFFLLARSLALFAVLNVCSAALSEALEWLVAEGGVLRADKRGGDRAEPAALRWIGEGGSCSWMEPGCSSLAALFESSHRVGCLVPVEPRDLAGEGLTRAGERCFLPPDDGDLVLLGLGVCLPGERTLPVLSYRVATSFQQQQ